VDAPAHLAAADWVKLVAGRQPLFAEQRALAYSPCHAVFPIQNNVIFLEAGRQCHDFMPPLN
jgi:hypothetical protein